MSESSNYNLTSEFRKNPDRAMWFVQRILPAMKQHFEEFDSDVVIGTLTDDNMSIRTIKTNFHRNQKKKKNFQATGVKRARAAYFFFCQDHRKQLQEDDEELDFGEVNKKLGDMWSNLSAKDRKPYDKKAQADRQRYESEYDAARQQAIASGEFTPDPFADVKKAKTSYLCFSTDPAIRKKHSKKASDNKELMKILGSVWGKMSDKDKEPYVNLANEDKERYQNDKKLAQKKFDKQQAALNKSQNQSDNESEEEAPAPKKAKKSSSNSKKSTKKPSKKSHKKKSVSSEEESE